MSKVKILFFAADPLSRPPHDRPPLDLAEDVRRVREKVGRARHRNALDFDWRLAARTDDLMQALIDERPQVVHFSGHGGTSGLILGSEDGREARAVDAATLGKLFRLFPGDIGVVVLNACLSLPQARAIADEVGCAIGTNASIPDEAAITFGAAFYRGIAGGESVKTAFDQASVAMEMEHPEARDCTELVCRDDVDPATLVLVQPEEAPASPWLSLRRWGARQFAAVTALLVLSGAALSAADWREDMTPMKTLMSPVAASTRPADPSRAEADLDAARDFYDDGEYVAAFPLFERAAQAGNTEAMGFLGIAYLKGQGTPRRADLANHYLREAVDKKRDPRAMYGLGLVFEQGDAKQQSYRWAMHWYREAAQGGYAPAMVNIGDLYRQGFGALRSSDSALAWYQRAIEARFPDALVDAGSVYEEERRDPNRARLLYQAAADSGSARGMFAMGRVYQEGIGVPRDLTKALAWYRSAARAGSAEAMNNLGVLYENGWGVRRSHRTARKWYRQAVAGGSTLAAANLATLEAN
jgi:TPR repeat protein